MPGFFYSLSVSTVMLNQTTKAPILETGKEAKTQVWSDIIPTDPEKAEELFLALMHKGATELWQREVKALWCPTKSPTNSSPPSTG